MPHCYFCFSALMNFDAMWAELCCLLILHFSRNKWKTKSHLGFCFVETETQIELQWNGASMVSGLLIGLQPTFDISQPFLQVWCSCWNGWQNNQANQSCACKTKNEGIISCARARKYLWRLETEKNSTVQVVFVFFFFCHFYIFIRQMTRKVRREMGKRTKIWLDTN